MSRRAWVVLGSAVALCVGLLVVLYQGFGRNPHEVPFMLTGQAAPPFELKVLETGQAVSLEELKGQPLVLNFWASWCGPCQVEHPVLEWGARRYGQQVRFLGVVFEDTEENARAFLSKHGASYPQLVDPRGRMAVDYGVAGVPETYFIDSAGMIRGKHVGPIDPQSLEARVQELLAAPQAAQP